MAKRGPTPSLIGGSLGAPRFVTAKKRRPCKRCDQPILMSAACVEVARPGQMGRKTFCTSCFGEILTKTRERLDALRSELDAVAE